VAASGIGYGKQRFPTIGVAVDYFIRHVRHCDPASDSSRPGAKLRAQSLSLFGMITAAVWGYTFVRRSPLHPYDD
jgi:hypothetical protein